MLSENLIKLYNTLALIETKGESTKHMAQCMAFVEQMVNEAIMSERAAAKESEEEPTTESEKEDQK